MPDSDLDEVDLAALREAMAIAMRDPDRRGQLTEMLQERPWSEVAMFAA
jgi:hypothetical protein